MKTLVVTIGILLSFISNGFADEIDDLARQYVMMPEVQKMIDGMFSQEAMLSQFEAQLPSGTQLSSEKKARIAKAMSDALAEVRPKLEATMISGSAKAFSVGEMHALIDFYQSEYGAAVMTKMQPYFQNVMVELAPQLQIMQQRITSEVTKILQEQ